MAMMADKICGSPIREITKCMVAATFSKDVNN